MSKSKNVYCSCLYYSANALSRQITKMADEEFAITGLGPSHGFLLMSIIGKPGIQPSELSEIMMLTPSTVTRLIEKLETKKLVERKREGKYSRAFPTKEGKKLDSKLKKAWYNLFERYTSVLGEKNSQKLTKDIYKAVTKLE